MQTLKHNKDATLQSWPQSPREWESDPVISFTVAPDKEVKPGDRIYTTTRMITAGPNSGQVMDIYYYIKDIQQVVPVLEANIAQITATAKRLEI